MRELQAKVYVAGVCWGLLAGTAVLIGWGCQTSPSGSTALSLPKVDFSGLNRALMTPPEPADNRSRQTALLPPPHIVVADPSQVDTTSALPVETTATVARRADQPNAFQVSVPDIDRVKAVQESDTLCWAACTQMLLRQYRFEVEQSQLAAAFVPDENDQSANVGIIMRALNPELEPQLQQRNLVPLQLFGTTSDQLVERLLAGELCVVGLVEDPHDDVGHACVVCGATFARLRPSLLAQLAAPQPTPAAYTAGPNDPNTPDPTIASNLNPQYGLYEVELFDPWPHAGGGRRVLSAADFQKQVRFITSHQIALDILERSLQAGQQSPQPGQIVLTPRTPENPRGVVVVDPNRRLERPEILVRPVIDRRVVLIRRQPMLVNARPVGVVQPAQKKKKSQQ